MRLDWTGAMRARVGWPLLAAAAVSLGGARVHGQTPSALARRDTTIRSYDGRSTPAQLLRLPVPERHGHPGRSITIAALRLPSMAPQPGRPIVFLMGGPGIPGSVMLPIPPYFTLFQRLRELGDVLVIDQRGIGLSEPTIDCAARVAAPTDLFLRRERLPAMMREQVAACAAHWRAAGYQPTAYSTLESAADLEDLRAALGVAQMDLLGFSYGSRLALAYLQRHPERVGRLALQGVNGPGLVVKRPGAVARKLQRMSDLLAHDSSWSAPTDLLRAAGRARERLAESPARIAITNRRDGRPVELPVGRAGFDELVALSLDDARLPALLVSVAAGDDRVLAGFAEAAWNGMNGGTVGLMARAVNCSADRPAERWRQAVRDSRTAPFGMPIDNAFLTDDFCRAVGFATPVPEFAGPVRSSAPALLLTGTLDATNPVENAEAVAHYLAHAVLLDVRNAPHEVLPIEAVQDVVVDFLRGSDVRERTIVAAPPHYLTVEEAARPAPARGR